MAKRAVSDLKMDITSADDLGKAIIHGSRNGDGPKNIVVCVGKVECPLEEQERMKEMKNEFKDERSLHHYEFGNDGLMAFNFTGIGKGTLYKRESGSNHFGKY